MHTTSSMAPTWDTSSFGHPADISTLERSALGDHLNQCGALRGPLHILRSGGNALHGLVAGRVVTSVVVLLVLFGGSWLMR